MSLVAGGLTVSVAQPLSHSCHHSCPKARRKSLQSLSFIPREDTCRPLPRGRGRGVRFLQEQRKQHGSVIESLGPWAICVITQSFSFLICKTGSHYHHSFVVSMKGNNDCGTLFTWYAPKACHFMIFKFWTLPPHHPPSKAGPRTT